MTDLPDPEHDAERRAGAGERLRWMARNPRSWVGVVVVLLVAGAGVVAALSLEPAADISAEVGDLQAMGSLTFDGSNPNGTVLFSEDLLPGEAVHGSVSLTNTGRSTGQFMMRPPEIADSPGPAGGNLSDVLRIEVVMDEGTPDEQVVYEGPLTAMPTIDLGEWPSDATHELDLTLSFPESSADASASAIDNQFQRSSVALTFIWDAVTS